MGHGKGDSCDPFTKNDAGRTPASQLSAITTRNNLRVVTEFAKYFGKSPDRLGPNELRTYQAYLLQERKLTPGTVVNRIAAHLPEQIHGPVPNTKEREQLIRHLRGKPSLNSALA